MCKIELVIEKDGDMWCTHDKDFQNLQISNAEFGKTPIESAVLFLSKWC